MIRDVRKPTKRARPARLRALVLLVASLNLLGLVSNFAHFLLVRHTVCPEHGELIHAGEPGHEVARSAPEREGKQPGVGAAATAASHGHDHCALLSDRRERLALRPHSPSVVPPHETELLAATWTRKSLHAYSVPLLFLAPKNSPPA